MFEVSIAKIIKLGFTHFWKHYPEPKKVHYLLDLLQIRNRISTKFVIFIRDSLYEIRTMYHGNIYRVFFIFDEGRIIV
nr:type II toxin-antitoxin system RelE/ParE family toxin [Odoribacter splanchnicus]